MRLLERPSGCPCHRGGRGTAWGPETRDERGSRRLRAVDALTSPPLYIFHVTALSTSTWGCITCLANASPAITTQRSFLLPSPPLSWVAPAGRWSRLDAEILHRTGPRALSGDNVRSSAPPRRPTRDGCLSSSSQVAPGQSRHARVTIWFCLVEGIRSCLYGPLLQKSPMDFGADVIANRPSRHVPTPLCSIALPTMQCKSSRPP